MTFGKDNAEIVVRKNDKWHIADIFTKSEVVIELQNSPIQKDVIRKGEEFYGRRMIWLINGVHFKDNFFIRELDDYNYKWNVKHNLTNDQKGKKRFCWHYARKCWFMFKRPVFIDFGEKTLFWIKEGMGAKHGIGEFVSKASFIDKYGGDYEYYNEQMAKGVRLT
ncbi:competence protein CoiA family protein [Kriegella aquimaris]|uniref:Competence protein CoiA-like family protein n=1 Tax=Kriegella aquimaris TaxID=192904 RepID=A0A1G9LCK9_9FLAO|nr:hypothetical protein [Kriegella aquimaris]SDL59712.1 hypothetical protein SAMN04488514_10211 [Kriegella aquimaris]